MAKGMYIGVGGVARKGKKAYVGVSNVARKVKKVYVGVGGVARLCYSAGISVVSGVPDLSINRSYYASGSTGTSYALICGSQSPSG
ncbi:MAG: hypothetical protein K0R92_2832, partial [Lachnospiraceae bacterium]|nr:hypothetical protein [Lachnospiraceae bacterium]